MIKIKQILIFCLIVFASTYNLSAQHGDKKSVESKTTIVKSIETIDAVPSDMLSEQLKSASKSVGNAVQSDGIVYDIVSSTNTTFNDCFKCGPAVGYETSCISKYTIETRRYSEWKNGKVARVWMNTVSLFMGCGTW